jgi:hypothetical protein
MLSLTLLRYFIIDLTGLMQKLYDDYIFYASCISGQIS